MLATHGYVPVDGSEIYYQTRGAGAPLLIVQGGLSEAGATEQLVGALAEHYLVITYDRRGLSRSTVSPDAPTVSIALHAADAGAVLAAVASEPARVVGASIGALIGLRLAVAQPELLSSLVAHEPPMSAVVFDQERVAALDEVAALARQDVIAAIQRMASLTGVGQESTEDGARPGRPVGDLEANLHWFFSHDFPAVRESTLDAKQVAGISPTAVIPTGGKESRGGWEYRCAHRLAEELGRELVELPGGHGGLLSHPRATAAELRRVFDGS